MNDKFYEMVSGNTENNQSYINDFESEESFGMTEKDLEETKAIMSKCPEAYKSELGDRKIEDLTLDDFDFQGFLIPHISLREALENLGFKVDKKTNKFYIDNDSPTLDKYPLILEDNGMGYGANNGKLTDCHFSEKDGEIHLWF